jgi:Flp pilus assembly protein TadG
MRLLRRRSNRTSGQAIVEFALLLPILIIIVLGIIEFGRLWMTMITLSSAAREGARVAAVTAPSQTQVEAAVNRVLDAAGLSEAAAITISGPNDENEVAVTVEITYNVLTGSIVPGLSGSMQLARSAVMRWEG